MNNHVTAVTYRKKKWLRMKAGFLNQFNTGSAAGSIFRNMAVLASGTLVARAIGFATIPIITRIYTPEHFGVLSVFTSLTALIVPLGTLRYSAAIPLPKKDKTATNLLVVCLSSLSVVTLLLFIVLWFFAPALLHLFSMDSIFPYWWLIVIAVAGTGLFEILSSWAIREKAFTILAKQAVWQSTFSVVVKIGLGFLGFKPLGLLIGQVVSQAGGSTSLTFSFFHKLRENLKHVSAKRLLFICRRYADFPKFRLPSQFLLVFSSNAPLLFSAMIFGKEITGQLGLALTTLALPISLIASTTGQAYYAEIARIGKKNSNQIRQITKSMVKNLFFVSIIPFLFILFSGPWLFTIVFGQKWLEAGEFSSILCLYLAAQFITTPLMNVLNVLEKQWLFLRINFVRVVILIIVFFVCYYLKLDEKVTLGIYSIALSIHYTIVSFTIFMAIK